MISVGIMSVCASAEGDPPSRMLRMHIFTTNGTFSVIVTNTSDSVEDAFFKEFVRGIKRVDIADRAGVTAYHSDRETEVNTFLNKTGNAPAPENATREEEKSDFLLALPPLSASGTLRDAVRAIPNTINGRKFDMAGFIPVWTGEKWVDGMPLVLNGFDVPEWALRKLKYINWAERSCGNYCYSEAERKEMDSKIRLGPPPTYPLPERRLSLAYEGYDLKFDKTFYIWRITGKTEPRIPVELPNGGQ